METTTASAEQNLINLISRVKDSDGTLENRLRSALSDFKTAIQEQAVDEALKMAAEDLPAPAKYVILSLRSKILSKLK